MIGCTQAMSDITERAENVCVEFLAHPRSNVQNRTDICDLLLELVASLTVRFWTSELNLVL